MHEVIKISDLEAGARVATVLLLKEKTLGDTKAGKKYLTLVLGNRAGQMEGKLWDEAELVDSQLERMTPVKVEGVVSIFRDKPQVTVRSIAPLKWTDELYDLLVPASPLTKKELTGRFNKLLSSLSNRHLKKLARTILDEPGVLDRFTAAPAAKMVHHAYVRGLMEHTVSMMEMASMLAEHYEAQAPGLVDRDMVVIGAMLHDLGKTTEYEFEQGIDFSTEGRLVGHLVLGIELVNRALDKVPGFPRELSLRVKHLVISHHGDFDKGAPVLPITPEALLLHQIDMMDSQMNALAMGVSSAGDDEYTEYSRKFQRRFLNPHAAAAEAPAPSPAPEPAPEPEPPTEDIPHPAEEDLPSGTETETETETETNEDPGGDAWVQELPDVAVPEPEPVPVPVPEPKAPVAPDDAPTSAEPDEPPPSPDPEPDAKKGPSLF